MKLLDLSFPMIWIIPRVRSIHTSTLMVRVYTPTNAKKKNNTHIHCLGTDKELLEKGNTLFRKCSILFGYIGLLSTVFANAILTNSKNAIKLVEWAVETNEEWGNLIILLGSIHR